MLVFVCCTGVSKSQSVSSGSKKAEEAVKFGRLVVTGQLLQMLSNSQRPRSTAAAAGASSDKKKPIRPLTWKFRDVSLKESADSAESKATLQTTADAPKLQTEQGVGTADASVENVQLDCAGEDAVLASADASDVPAVNATSPNDTFCPKITSIVSLEDTQ